MFFPNKNQWKMPIFFTGETPFLINESDRYLAITASTKRTFFAKIDPQESEC